MRLFRRISLFAWALFVAVPALAERHASPFIGGEDFIDMTNRTEFFVDKTLFVKEVLESNNKAILITRPRRWGKSINMSILKYFLNRVVDTNGELVVPNPHYNFFENLKIGQEKISVYEPQSRKWENVKILDTFQGRYPVISVSFKDAGALNFIDMKKNIGKEIYRVFKQHEYLANSSKLSQRDKEAFLERLNGYSRFTHSTVAPAWIQQVDISDALRILSGWLHLHHGKKTFILIDEYDTPLSEAIYNQEAIVFMRGLLSSALKGNDEALEKGILTGISRLAKSDLFSGLNNLSENSLLDPAYACHFGFTQDEVEQLYSSSNVFNRKSIEAWYGGYRVGDQTIYNPWSLMNHLNHVYKQKQPNLKPESHWVDTGGFNSAIKERLFSKTPTRLLWENVENGEEVSVPVQKFITTQDLGQTSDIYSLLFHSGYLTRGDSPFTVKVPNKEVRGELKRLLGEHLDKELHIKEPFFARSLFNAITTQDLNKVRSILSAKKSIDVDQWNFNFLQIAALVGNRIIFNLIADHYPDQRESLSSEGLSLIDFAVLGNKGFNPEGYQAIFESWQYFGFSVFNSVYGIASYVAVPTLLAAPGIIFKNRFDSWVRTMVLTAGMATALLNTVVKDIFFVGTRKLGALLPTSLQEGYAQACLALNADITNPKELNSLAGFEKYIMNHPNSYVTLGRKCVNDDELLAKKTVPALVSKEAQFFAFDFLLCTPRS